MASKFPSFSQWKQIFKVLSNKEKVIILVLFLLTFFSFTLLAVNLYLSNTKLEPALAGSYTEGIIGQPRLINPIYGETNDIDRTLINLVFSGLMTYDNQGSLVKDLAENYKISEDGKVYEFQLRDNILWHDGKPLTTDDILFTIQTIQNSDYKSPLRANWIDVRLEKISNKSLRFILQAPYNSFLENLTLKILPKHIFETVSPENFTLTPYNLQPVGSGPYKFLNIQQTATGFVKSMDFQSNRRYYQDPSHILTLSFHFFENKEQLIAAVNQGEIEGFSVTSFDDSEAAAEKAITQGWLTGQRFLQLQFQMPRYFAVFFNNQKVSIFKDEDMRKAMTLSVNKDELIQTINKETKNNNTRVDSPILSDFFGYKQPTVTYNFDQGNAKILLDKEGFKDVGSSVRQKPIDKKQSFQFRSYMKVGSSGSEVSQLQACLPKLDESFKMLLQNAKDGKYGTETENAVTEFQKKYLADLKPTGETGAATRQKLNELCFANLPNSQPLSFTLTTVNQPQLMRVADLLKKYWQDVGADVQIKAVSITELRPIIKNRSYDALLYGEALGAEPDLYPFWHSSQKIDPGLNLSSYENKDIDKLLKEARETTDGAVKIQKYEKLQDTLLANAPALFLYNPDYIYWISDKVQGVQSGSIVDPAKRFVDITHWYIKTKRSWK